MAGLVPGYGILPVDFYDFTDDEKRIGDKFPVNPSSPGFPFGTLITLDGTPKQVRQFDPATYSVAYAHESDDDFGLNIQAGPQVFVPRKDDVYVIPVDDKRLVMTASWTGGTPVFLDPTHIGQQFELALDPATGYTFVDLTTAGGGPAKIVDYLFIPGGPRPFDTSLPDDLRKNARVIVEIDPAACATV